MKNLSLVLNIILLGAVSFLFYKEYSEKEESEPISIPAPTGPVSIVHINSDSLLENYTLYVNFRDQFEKKHDSIQRILDSRMKSLQDEAQVYLEKEGALMTEQQRAEKEDVLRKKQQDIVELKKSMFDKLGDEEDMLNDSIHNNLVNYLKKYNQDKNFNYILGYQKGGGILLANDSLDITKQIVKGLNDELEK